jgi:chromosome segregation protein
MGRLWSPSQLTPKTPREMRAWLQAAADIVRLRSELGGEQSRYDEIDAKLSETTDRLHKLAKGLGIEASGPVDLLKATAAAVSAMETTFQNARLIAQEREGCERRQREFQAALDELDRQEAEWRSQWSAAAGVIGLREEAGDEEAEAALSIWQAVPALEASMRDLEHRIERIEQDQMAFREAAVNLCAAVAPDLDGADPVSASATLRQRLVEARDAATTRAGLTARLAELDDKAGERRRQAQLNDSELAALCTAAGIAEPDELAALAERIEQDSKLSGELAKERKALLDAADGLGEAELRAELAGHDPDSLTARLQELGDDQEAGGRLDEAISAQTRAEKKLDGHRSPGRRRRGGPG